MMNKYIGITIGPIVKTLMMARKPRELFSASFFCSYLSKCIIKCIIRKIEEKKSTGTILSPAYYKGTDDKGIGLYPDRIFYRFGENDEFSFQQVLEEALNSFKQDMFGEAEVDDFIKDYFKISALQIEAEKDKTAVRVLNRLLDGVELANRSIKNETSNPVLTLIKKVKDSRLFKQALGEKDYKIATLGEIAVASLNDSKQENSNWEQCKKLAKSWEDEPESKQRREIEKLLEGKVPDDVDDVFYALLRKLFKTDFKSYHKYICVVQADGDNMGKIVNDLDDGKLIEFSTDLVNFDVTAKKLIENYGGLPIYAGGDDLLFIAPVVGKKEQNIFGLLQEIDKEFHERMYENGLCKYSAKYFPSMSYGVAITYYKYPLYEALEQARHLLFSVAKEVRGKDAVAWTLQKNSGSALTCALSKSQDINEQFDHLLTCVNMNKIDGNFISGVAHKIRVNRQILSLIIRSKDYERHLTAFFQTFLGAEGEKGDVIAYLENVKRLMSAVINYFRKMPVSLMDEVGGLDNNMPREKCTDGMWEYITSKVIEEVYCILRTVKFVKGLEDSHE